MAKIKVGDMAPEFNLPASNGKNLSLKDYLNKSNVVLYFYPKDDTPGCTTEACGFRDSVKSFAKNGAEVIGISPDSIAQHEKFINKHQLPFLLLSDESKKICRAYGVWVEKSMYGKKYMGVQRTTFVIDKKGKIAHIFDKVKPQGHDEEILSVLNDM